MTDQEAMEKINDELSHIWMVRTFLKHCEEAEGDDELMEIPRKLYDFSLSLGPRWSDQDAAGYMKMAKKKFSKLKQGMQDFTELQPEISSHTNFQMSEQSLRLAVLEIEKVLQAWNQAH